MKVIRSHGQNKNQKNRGTETISGIEETLSGFKKRCMCVEFREKPHPISAAETQVTRPACTISNTLESALSTTGVHFMFRRLLVLSLAFAVLLTSLTIPQARAADREINVAAAADLSVALQEAAAGYEKRTGVAVKLSFGASGALTQQIQNGAPFDIFFSADMDYPRQLISGGQADGATLYRYAVGRLVLWVPEDSPLDVEHKGIEVLLDPSVKKIAVANPQHAPYGRAAFATLKHYGLDQKVADKLVVGENIAQAAQFVESGNAQAGFVALAHALAPAMQGKGKYWLVPADAYPPLDQGVVLISPSAHRQDAAAFLEYVKSADFAAVLRRYGFSLPEKQ
jgi:molybdate transport system substrate-binding protein